MTRVAREGKGQRTNFFVFAFCVFFSLSFSVRHAGTGNNGDAAISRCKAVTLRITFSLDELRRNEIAGWTRWKIRIAMRRDGSHEIEVERPSFEILVNIMKCVSREFLKIFMVLLYYNIFSISLRFNFYFLMYFASLIYLFSKCDLIFGITDIGSLHNCDHYIYFYITDFQIISKGNKRRVNRKIQ